MISLIFACDPNHLIGIDNDLPWHYSEDLKYFKKKTLNKTVLMGEKTFYSITDRLGHPLPHRTSVVASLEPFKYEGVKHVKDLFAYLKKEHEEEIFVIGGKTIYELAFKYADRLYITHIKKEHKGNVYLNFSLDNFKLVSESETENVVFAIYERK